MEGKRSSRPTQTGQTEEELNFFEHYSVDNDKFRILYTNADCFTNKRNDLSLLLGTLNYKPNVIVITEVNSKAFSNNLLKNDFNLLGYNIFASNVAVLNKRGLIVYVDSSFDSCLLEIVEDFAECIFVKISVDGGTLVTIGAFYRSPGSALENDIKLFKVLDSFSSSTQGKLLLLGDFNLPNIKWGSSTCDSNLNPNSIAFKFISCL